MNEQDMLLSAICAGARSSDAAIAVYQRNRFAQAERALAISFPLIAALLGEGFSALVYRFVLQHPPTQSDWGEWGAVLPEYISQQTELAHLPYLMDCAQLDWAAHTIERNNNDVFLQTSLAQLAEQSADELVMVLNRNIALLSTPFPLYAIWKMHQPNEEGSTWSQRAARELQSAPHMEYLVLSRTQWRTQVTPISEAEYLFMQAILQGKNLTELLLVVEGTEFQFSDWLLAAINHQWLHAIRRLPA